MNNICPLCNGLYEIKYKCKDCNIHMEDKGAKVNYMDSYSLNLLDDISHLVDGVAYDKCVHIYYCPKCHKSVQYSIERREF